MKRKRCPKCGKNRKISEFHRDRSRKDGLFPWCKPCHREHSSFYRNGLPKEELRRRQAEQRAKRDANAEARAKYLRYSQIYGLKRRYGVSIHEILAMAESQNGVCAICGDPPRKGPHGGLHIDHDHKKGKVRGLLCNSCNVALGHFRDDVSRLRSAVEYLLRTSPRSQ